MKYQYDPYLIANLLTNADWDYTYNMERIDESTMNGLIGELGNSTFTAEEVEKAIAALSHNAIEDFENQSETADINIYIGWLIADSIALAKVKCPYQSVTFSAAL